VVNFNVLFVLDDSMTETLLCSASVALGLALATPEAMRNSPLPGTLDRPVLILLSVALGRFIFTVVHLLSQFFHATTDSAWTTFRAIYAIVNVICLSDIVVSRNSLLLAVMILFLELGMAVEEASTVVERIGPARSLAASTVQRRLERVLTTIGAILVAVVIPVPIILFVVAVSALQSSFTPSPLGFGLLCFAFIFYSLIAVFMLIFRRLQRRCRLVVVPRLPSYTYTPGQQFTRRKPLVGPLLVDNKRRRIRRAGGVGIVLHAIRSRRVCNVDVYNAVRTAAASTLGLSSYGHRHRLNASSSAC